MTEILETSPRLRHDILEKRDQACGFITDERKETSSRSHFGARRYARELSSAASKANRATMLTAFSSSVSSTGSSATVLGMMTESGRDTKAAYDARLRAERGLMVELTSPSFSSSFATRDDLSDLVLMLRRFRWATLPLIVFVSSESPARAFWTSSRDSLRTVSLHSHIIAKETGEVPYLERIVSMRPREDCAS